MPLALLGTKCIIYDLPEARPSWEPHETEGWYIGPALQHFWCYSVCTPSTKAECNRLTVEFFPIEIQVPETTDTDRIVKAARDLKEASMNPLGNAPMKKLGPKI